MGKKIGFVLALFIVAGFARGVFSQEYPTKPITVVHGNDAGSFLDITTRTICEGTKKALGQDMLIEYKVGASHMVALSYVLAQKPDGYTLFSASDAPFIRGPYMMKLKFDPIKETVPIIFYAGFAHFLVVSADSPYKTLKDLLAYAKQNPGKVTIGNPGFGTVPYITMAGIETETGLKFSHIPFAGEPKEIAAILGGHITTAGIAIVSCIAQVRSGQLRALAVLQGDRRLSDFPEIPTLKEVAKEFGMKTSVIYPGQVIAGHKDLPEPIVKKLADAFEIGRKSPVFQKYAQENYLFQDNMPITGQALKDYLNKGYKEMGVLAQQLGIQKK
jgi:tripartite-type tricarboxylate transporter receptor subunit TctC